MRSMWKGHLSALGFMFPVKLYATLDTERYPFHQVHASDGGRVRMQRVCQIDGQIIPEYDQIAKGYEMADGEMLVLTDEAQESLPVPSLKSIEVDTFVSLNEIDPWHYAGKNYFIEPENTPLARRAYKLLRDAMRAKKKVGIVKVTLRDREHVAVVREVDKTLMLMLLTWHDQERTTEELRGLVSLDDVKTTSQEKDLSLRLVDALSGEFKPETYVDEYKAAVAAWVEGKIDEKLDIKPARAKKSATKKPTEPDLIGSLEASLAAAKSA